MNKHLKAVKTIKDNVNKQYARAKAGEITLDEAVSFYHASTMKMASESFLAIKDAFQKQEDSKEYVEADKLLGDKTKRIF